MGYMWRRVIDSEAMEINRSLSIGLNHFRIRPYCFQEQKLVSSAVKTFIREQFFICVFKWWLVWSLNFDTCPNSRASCANTFGLQITVKLSNQSGIQSTQDLLNAASVLSWNIFKYCEAFRFSVISYSEAFQGISSWCSLLFSIYWNYKNHQVLHQICIIQTPFGQETLVPWWARGL